MTIPVQQGPWRVEISAHDDGRGPLAMFSDPPPRYTIRRRPTTDLEFGWFLLRFNTFENARSWVVREVNAWERRERRRRARDFAERMNGKTYGEVRRELFNDATCEESQ